MVARGMFAVMSGVSFNAAVHRVRLGATPRGASSGKQESRSLPARRSMRAGPVDDSLVTPVTVAAGTTHR